MTVRGDPQVIAAAALSLLDPPGVAALIGYLRHPSTLPRDRLERRARGARVWASRDAAARGTRTAHRAGRPAVLAAPGPLAPPSAPDPQPLVRGAVP